MLFSFDRYWKYILVLSLGWVFYALFDFEFTIVTLLSVYFAHSTRKFYVSALKLALFIKNRPWGCYAYGV